MFFFALVYYNHKFSMATKAPQNSSTFVNKQLILFQKHAYKVGYR